MLKTRHKFYESISTKIDVVACLDIKSKALMQSFQQHKTKRPTGYLVPENACFLG